MKKHKRYLFICIAVCSLLFSGCGNALYELTAEEEDLIVHYAAYVVAKHNMQQKDGVTNVIIPEEDSSSEDADDPTDTETETESEDSSQVVEGDSGEDGKTGSISLAEAIGHSQDLSVTYGGSYLANNYVEGAAYSVDAAEGKIFYVMKFVITNTTASDVYVDNVKVNPGFKLVTSNLEVRSEVTFLMTDFSTYTGTIAAGQSVETILLFEVPQAGAEQISEPTLQIIVNNETKVVKL